MTTISHARLNSRFIIEMKGNHRRKKLRRTNQGSNILGGSFSNRDNVKAKTEFRRERQPSIIKDYFSSRTNPSIFTSVAPVLLDWSNDTN